jgi:hypothetical protein
LNRDYEVWLPGGAHFYSEVSLAEQADIQKKQLNKTLVRLAKFQLTEKERVEAEERTRLNVYVPD